MPNCLIILLAVLSGLVAMVSPVRAGSIVAIVEDVKAEGAGVAFMEYLPADRTIALGKAGRLVVGYLNSCLREVIVGGNVTIGTEKSTVTGGTIRRERVECDGGRLLLTAEQAGKSAVIVFRKGKGAPGGAAQEPSLRIYSLQPIIQVKSRPAAVTIDRLDRPEKTLTVSLRDGIADLADGDLTLVRGALYRIAGGGKSRVIRIDSYAGRSGSVISRLVAF